MEQAKFLRKTERLSIIEKPNSCQHGAGTHQRQGKRQEGKKSEKSEEKERDRGIEGKPSTPARANDALRGEIEQNGKQKKKQTERNKERTWSRPTTRMDHLVGPF